MNLSARWAALWAELNLTMPDTARSPHILARYAEPQRAYHTVQHLHECLTWFDDARSLARDPPLLEMAIWYHDAVYQPRRSDNEQASADLARVQLKKAGAAAQTAEQVAALILWTTHAAEPPAGDPALLVDIDLAILGASTARYAEYERQIRHEYAWVPMFLFRRRRAALLTTFLERSRIFSTALLYDRLEQQARANLAGAIGVLRGA